MLRVAPLVAALAACAHPADIDPPAPDGLADRFELIAFHNEVTGDEVPLSRWDGGPIDILVTERYRAVMDSLAGELSALTGRQISTVDTMPTGPAPGNAIIVVVDQMARLDVIIAQGGDQMRYFREARETGRFDCAAQIHGYGDGIIRQAIVMIDSARGNETIERCIVQEMTQVLGLPNDIDDPDGTVFSTRSTRTTLSESDRNIVRILYDPRLQPGMTRTEAMPIVREIAAELDARQSEVQTQGGQPVGTE